MKKIIVFVMLLCIGSMLYSGERITTIPIRGGFGINLGEKLTPLLAKQLKAKRVKSYKDEKKGYEDDTVWYQVSPPNPFRYFNEYRIAVTKKREIYRIEGRYIKYKLARIYELLYRDALFRFEKKNMEWLPIRNMK